MALILSLNIINKALAADPVSKEVGTLGGIGLGPFGRLAEKLRLYIGLGADPKIIIGNDLNAVVSIIIGFLTAIAALWFIIRIVLGGISWLSSGGDQKSLQNAQQTITNAIIGLTIVVASYAIISVISSLLGLDILNPAKVLQFIP